MTWPYSPIYFKKVGSDAYTVLSSTIKDSHHASCVFAERLLDEARGALLAFTTVFDDGAVRFKICP